MEVCSGCGEQKELSCFRLNHPGGHPRKFCKTCDVINGRKRTTAYNQRNKEKQRIYDSQRRVRKPRDKRKDRARWNLHYAIRSGKIQKPLACTACGERAKIHAHHHDYSKPLEVEWLCQTCHGIQHRKY